MDATFSTSFSQGSDYVAASVTVSADTKDYFEVALPAGAVTNVTFNVDPDALQGYVILSDVNCTLTTTNSTGTGDVVSLVANQPLQWNAKMYWPNGVFVNRNPWTNLAFNNAGSVAGTLKALFLRDGTP